MAVQAFDKEYTLDRSGGTDGYNALVADMRSWYNWDEVDDTTDASSTLFKKFQPGSTTKWVGINLKKSTGNGTMVETQVYNGAKRYVPSWLFGQSNCKLQYAAVVVTDKGFFMMASERPMPLSGSYYGHTFGIYSSTDKTTGAAGVCTVGVWGETGLYILGDSTTDATTSLYAVSPKRASNGIVAHIPLFHPYTKDVPDDILQLVYKPVQIGTNKYRMV